MIDLQEALQACLSARAGPRLVVLCGSNGAGKSTFYRRYLSHLGLTFVNADDIARALHPESPEIHSYEAMQLAEQLRQELFESRRSFCMETVLSDTQGAKLTFLQQTRDAGYTVIVIFIRISSPELSQARVAQRVQQGGHDVPEDKVFARFPRTLENAAKALALAHLGLLLDNSDARNPYQLIEVWQDGTRTDVA